MDTASKRDLSRRAFVYRGAATVASVWGVGHWPLARQAFAAKKAGPPDLVAVRNGEPDLMFDRAMAALGGMGRFVRKGQTVVVKPNIGWDRPPESGANTNPLLVQRIVEQCLQAGAKKVYVFDYAVDDTARAYRNSGIEAAVKKAKGTLVPADKERYYQDVAIPAAKVLKKAKVHQLLLGSHLLINVPVLKHHGSTQVTVAMKNLMGCVWDRRWYHRHGLHESIADFCLAVKPTLNVVDAYRMTLRNGPARAKPEDVVLRKSLLVSTDIVAVDAAATALFGSEPSQIPHIVMGHEMKLGTMTLSDLQIARIAL